MEYEEMLVTNEFSEIIRYHNRALERLKRFQEGYPYLIAPNVFSAVEFNLKENITVLYREFQGLQNQKEKKYDTKHTCRKCNQVFFTSLPDGLCDECRGKGAPE